MSEDVIIDLEPQPHGGALKRQQLVPHVLTGEICEDPAQWGWPPTFAAEVALQTQSIRELCEENGITRERWNEIRKNPAFVAEVTAAAEFLRKEGAAFRFRAQLQSTELLKDSWSFIHNPAWPPAVRADLLKFTIKIAGLDASKDQGILGKGGAGGGLAINIIMGG